MITFVWITVYGRKQYFCPSMLLVYFLLCRPLSPQSFGSHSFSCDTQPWGLFVTAVSVLICKHVVSWRDTRLSHFLFLFFCECTWLCAGLTWRCWWAFSLIAQTVYEDSLAALDLKLNMHLLVIIFQIPLVFSNTCPLYVFYLIVSYVQCLQTFFSCFLLSPIIIVRASP